MNICLLTEDEAARGFLGADDERARHIIRILKKNSGEKFSAGIIGGAAGSAVIASISKEEGIRFEFTGESDGKPLLPLEMIIGFPRPIQLKRLLRDMAGLGVSAVHLTGTDLGEKSYMQSTLLERGAAQKMLLDGAAQAASTHIPALFLHKSLCECLDSVLNSKADFGRTAILAALDNARPSLSLKNFLEQKEPGFALAAVGSERGWTERERGLLERRGFTLCSMGSRILRTESAATVSASIILAEMGLLA